MELMKSQIEGIPFKICEIIGERDNSLPSLYMIVWTMSRSENHIEDESKVENKEDDIEVPAPDVGFVAGGSIPPPPIGEPPKFIQHPHKPTGEAPIGRIEREFLLHRSINRGDITEVKKLVLQDININYKLYYNTPLTLAARLGHVDILKVLIEANADVDRVGCANKLCTPLIYAAKYHENTSTATEMIAILLEADADINKADILRRTPLHWAAFIGNLEGVKRLVNAGADVNIVDTHERTALHRAVENTTANRSDIIRYLVNNGSNIDAKDMEGWTPLTISVIMGNLDNISELLSLGSNVNLKDNFKRPLIMIAQDPINQPKIAEQLIATRMINPDKGFMYIFPARDNISKQKACDISYDVMKLLLNYGADPHCFGSLGGHGFFPSAFYHAVMHLDISCAMLLIDAGGDLRLHNFAHFQLSDNNNKMVCDVKFVLEQRGLMELCKLVIRQHISGNKEKTAYMLNLPMPLAKFVANVGPK
ncbi:unnamed protein product [Owenia fusiformis]|uniref:Uncharacterized protein n=1 Tax=Owenia fusiformis TaxID=6347 RepID=A0A8J1TCL7_OWEFU|nr:unnamed protein product [Owenia fusiformis]